MAEKVKRIIQLEVDVNSGEVKQLNSELKKTEKSFKDTKKETSSWKDKLLTVGDAIKGMGIGLAVAGLAKFTAALQKNQRIADATESAMNGLEIVFSKLTNTVVDGLGLQEKSWRDVLSGIVDVFDVTGITSALLVDTNKEYIDNLQEVSEQITQNRKDLALMEVQQREMQLLNQKEAEIQRQLRDDYNLTFEERFAANDALAVILDESIKSEKELVNQRIANLEYEQENLEYSFDRYIEIRNLKVELTDIEERIIGVKSEQQAAERSLLAEQKAAEEERKRMAKERAEASQKEMDDIMAMLEEQMTKEGELEYAKRRERQHRLEEAQAKQDEAAEEARKEYFDQLEQASDAYAESQMSAMDLEIRLVQDQYFKLIEEAEQYGEDKAELTEQQEAIITEIKNRYAKQQADEQKKLDQDVQSAKLGLAADTFGALIELNNAFAGETEEAQRKAFQFDKALRLGQSVMSSIQGVQNAFTTASASPITAAFPAYPFIQASVAGAFGAAQVAAIARSRFDSSSGGSSANISAPTAQAQAPQFNTVGTSGFNQLSESIASQNKQPVKAYVVANDVSTAQSLDRNKVEQASFP